MENTTVKRSLLFLLFICGAVYPALGQTIVDCDATVQSQKRGLAVGSMSAADFQAIAPGVSWYYNWSTTPLTVPAGASIQFLPMCWNGTSGAEAGLRSYLSTGMRPSYVLALNEPNFTSQSNMTPQQSATAYSQIDAICAPYNIPVVAPQMAIGSAAADSITAFDPIQNTTVTYTYQEPFLHAFQYYCGASVPPAMSTHSYGGYGEVTWITSTMHTDFPNQKVWLTEFNQNDSTSDATSVADVISTVDYCERTPWIQGYAWFMSRVGGNPYNSIFTTASGILTPAGQAYVQMPVHLPDLYYRIPGTLLADRYVTMNNMNIEPSTDTGVLADMVSTAGNGSATIDYNLQVDTAGTYSLDLRAANATGAIGIYKGSTLLSTVNVTSTLWAAYRTTLNLAAGTQTLHLVLASNSQKISSLQFVAPGLAPIIDSATTASGSVGTSFSYTIMAANGPTSYFATGLPAGLNINTNTGVISGTPSTAGSSNVTLHATNSAGTGTATLFLTINATSVTDLALKQPATASSFEEGNPVSNANDGNVKTRWAASKGTVPQWWEVDLGASHAISSVNVDWYNNASRYNQYTIQTSPDKVKWTTLVTKSTNKIAGPTVDAFNATARYVRINVSYTSAGYVSAWEIQVFGH